MFEQGKIAGARKGAALRGSPGFGKLSEESLIAISFPLAELACPPASVLHVKGASVDTWIAGFRLGFLEATR